EDGWEGDWGGEAEIVRWEEEVRSAQDGNGKQVRVADQDEPASDGAESEGDKADARLAGSRRERDEHSDPEGGPDVAVGGVVGRVVEQAGPEHNGDDRDIGRRVAAARGAAAVEHEASHNREGEARQNDAPDMLREGRPAQS